MVARLSYKICTIGFAGKTAEQFFNLLGQAGVRTVIDVRENRGGQLSGYAKYPDIAFFLKRVAEIEYRHEPLFAPTTEIRKAYRDSKNWEQYEKSFRQLMCQRNLPGGLDMGCFPETVALLCSEPGPEKCHRRLVAEMAAQRLRAEGKTAEICHLVIEKPAKSRRKARSNDKRPADQ